MAPAAILPMVGRIWSVQALAKGDASLAFPLPFSAFGLGAVAALTLALDIPRSNRVAVLAMTYLHEGVTQRVALGIVVSVGGIVFTLVQGLAMRILHS